MKQFISNNEELNEILVNNGINLICNEEMKVIISDEDAERIPAIVEQFAPAASQDYCIENCEYAIYYTDNCDSFHFDKKSFATLEEAKSFCDNYVKDDQPYDWTDTPDTNNHYHLEVYAGNSIDEDPVYQTKDYYKD